MIGYVDGGSMMETTGIDFIQSFEAKNEGFSHRQTSRVLFVCSSNEALSLLGEAFLRHLDTNGQYFEVFSAAAGPQPAFRPHPLALAMIDEMGGDTTQLHTKALSDYQKEYFDYIIIVDDMSVRRYRAGRLPLPTAARILTWDFPDPTILPEYVQAHSFHQIGDGLYNLIRSLAKSPNFAKPLRNYSLKTG